MDNKCSQAVQHYIQNHDIRNVLANQLQENTTERALQKFKNHFIKALATLDKNFPMQLWDELIV